MANLLPNFNQKTKLILIFHAFSKNINEAHGSIRPISERTMGFPHCFFFSLCFPLFFMARTFIELWSQAESRMLLKRTPSIVCSIILRTTGKFVRGFRMLTLGWSDGNTFIPLAFSLLSSEKKKHRFQEVNSTIDKRTVGYKCRKEALKKSTEAMFDLLDEVNPLQDVQKHCFLTVGLRFPKGSNEWFLSILFRSFVCSKPCIAFITSPRERRTH